MLSFRGAFALTLFALIPALPASAADIPGSKDPAFLKRFQGSEIINYESQPFDQLYIAAPDPKNPTGYWNFTPAEGQITRIVYHLPSSHSVLEVLRNYEQALKAAGLAQVDEKRGAPGDVRDFGGSVYHQNWETNGDFAWTNLGLSGIQQYGYVTAKGNAGGNPVKVAVFIASGTAPGDVTYQNKVHFTPDQPVVIVDVATALPLGKSMVTGANKADISGSKDSFLKRFQGSQIINYEAIPYDELAIAAPDPKNLGSWVTAKFEGQITRVIYQLPAGHSAMETLRNYEQALRDAGMTQLDERLGGTDVARDFAGTVYHQSWETNGDYSWTNLGLTGMQQFGYVTAQGAVGGKAAKTQVFIATYKGVTNFTYKNKGQFVVGQPIVIVDTVISKELANQMVTVKAADMASALAAKGVVDLYGVYFDVDKTDVKPESTATLNEIASLLKSNTALKLEISGHTDNTGSKDHNMVLSQGRANSVMALLVAKYGIDAGRLTAKGYGDTKPVAPNTSDANKAKNRRVELRKI